MFNFRGPLSLPLSTGVGCSCQQHGRARASDSPATACSCCSCCCCCATPWPCFSGEGPSGEGAFAYTGIGRNCVRVGRCVYVHVRRSRAELSFRCGRRVLLFRDSLVTGILPHYKLNVINNNVFVIITPLPSMYVITCIMVCIKIIVKNSSN